MLRNHLKFALRLFVKDRFYSLLNIGGLALGITTGIILLLILQSDLGYDRHHKKHERIFRYTQKLKAPGAEFDVALSARELPPIIYQEVPGIEAIVRFELLNESLIRIPTGNGDIRKFAEDRIFRTDSTIFDVFTLEVIEGNPATALKGKNKAVLNASTSYRFFGKEPALGKTFMMPDSQLYEVTAVIKDLPKNSHFIYDILLSGIEPRNPQGDLQTSETFWNPGVYTYLLFRDKQDETKFYDNFPAIHDKTYKLFGTKIDGKVTPLLEPLADIHFYSTKDGDFPKGDVNYLYASIAIGIFIILLACINYMNMSTARATKRTSEMAVRKVLGLQKFRLFGAVLFEALLMAFVSMILAIGLSYYIIEFTGFNNLLGKELEFNLIDNGILLVGIFILTLFIGLLSGIYPALYIPSIPVTEALKGNKTIKFGGGWIRKSLIGFQFFLSLTVIICTVIMERQINFLHQKDIGFDKNNVVVLPIKSQTSVDQINHYGNQLLQNPNIAAFTTSSSVPGNGLFDQVFKVEDEEQGMVQQQFKTIYVGDRLINTLGIGLEEGRAFIEGSESEIRYSFIINEAAKRALGWDEGAVGKNLTYFHDENMGQVVGVLKDFNFTSLHNNIVPMVMIYNPDYVNYILVKVTGNDLPQTLDFIGKEWSKFDPVHPFDYSFLDQAFYEQYQADQLQYQLIMVLSFICIFISLLGLIGLSAFTASQKTKEIGIRKSLGANVSQILVLFSKDYFKLIIISFLIAIPVANYVIKEWLGNFAYQIDLSFWYFLLPGVAIMIVAIITISVQSLKAAKTNPVNALAHE
ncbi:MAG: FtsX-like permease family protein [Candidatus Cyclobacteriaceae bacterium M2_1C_046]